MMMNSGVLLTPSTSPPSSSSSLHPHQNSPSFLGFSNNSRSIQHQNRRICVSPSFFRPTTRIYCSNNSPGSSGSGDESDNRTVLDAFFLGKALGEALTERIESTVGEVLSTIGRLQAEQQKQIQEFQEDVLERAKKAKEKAAREALQEQGRLIPSSTKEEETEPVTNGAGPSSGPTEPVTSPAASVDNQNSSPSSVDEDPSDYVTRIQIDE